MTMYVVIMTRWLYNHLQGETQKTKRTREPLEPKMRKHTGTTTTVRDIIPQPLERLRGENMNNSRPVFMECKFPSLIIKEAVKNDLTVTQINNLKELFYSELKNANLDDVLGVIFELGKIYERTLTEKGGNEWINSTQ